MGALKVTALTCFSLAAFGGGIYGSTQIFKEEEIPWQSLWIYKDSQEDSGTWKEVCELPEELTKKNKSSKKVKRDLQGSQQEPSSPEAENHCNLSDWFQKIIKDNKSKQKDGWWIKGRDEETINKMLENEPLLGDKIPEKLERKVENPPKSNEEKPSLKVEDLRKYCEVKERTFFSRKIEITCLEDQQSIKKKD
ncbi:hypothetical protein MSUIS_06270 [Mycoplasma suis KI3806]|uniref:Uncharacterized protein n=1 Tax=Mycoplasma suis (strain KI_3806) TaxID=708248 RepID=F0V239_MYCS3|nr:hypothetical protein [Mycoplasma suis]CBZ40720.1 hypothetical protein MSUIS_06270 [Mycoplasma suis KI3806]